MPFADEAARREYMRKYLADYRQGKRRTDPEKVTQRTRKARAAAEKKRKALWYLKNKEWCLAQQRQRRRAARADAERALLQSVPPRPMSTAKVSTNHKKRTQRKAA